MISLPDGRLRGFVYALPIPMSIAIVASPTVMGGTQLLGVPLLVGFFFLVTVAERPWGRLAAVLCALGALVAVGAILNSWLALDWPAAYVVTVALWLAGMAVARLLPLPAEPAADGMETASRRVRDDVRVADSARPRSTRVELAERLPALGSALLTSGVSFLFGGLLGPFVVTFPYSGAPVAFLLHGGVARFAREFAVRSIFLSAFLAGYHESRKVLAFPAALLVAWAVYLAGSGLLMVAQRLRTVPALNSGQSSGLDAKS